MRRYVTFLLIMLIGGGLCAGDVRQAWEARVVETRPLPAIGGEYRQVQFASDGAGTIEVHAVRVPAGVYRARVVDQPDNEPQHPTVSSTAKRAGAFLAVNGGYFLPDFRPAGLCLIDGKELAPLSRQASLSGILTIDAEGRLALVPRGEEIEEARHALQVGPFIIDPGGKRGIYNDSGKRARRTIVAETRGGDLLVMSTSAASLYEVSECLASYPQAFGVKRIERALNLDGGSSAGMYVATAGAPVKVRERLPVRNIVLFMPGEEEWERGE